MSNKLILYSLMKLYKHIISPNLPSYPSLRYLTRIKNKIRNFKLDLESKNKKVVKQGNSKKINETRVAVDILIDINFNLYGL